MKKEHEGDDDVIEVKRVVTTSHQDGESSFLGEEALVFFVLSLFLYFILFDYFLFYYIILYYYYLLIFIYLLFIFVEGGSFTIQHWK